MKTNKVLILTTALVLGLTSISSAKYLSGFEVIGVSDGQITIQKGKADPVNIPKGKKVFKVGDKVSFDAKKLKLRKYVEGC